MISLHVLFIKLCVWLVSFIQALFIVLLHITSILPSAVSKNEYQTIFVQSKAQQPLTSLAVFSMLFSSM